MKGCVNISAYDGWNVPKVTQPYTRLIAVHIFYCALGNNWLDFAVEVSRVLRNDTFSYAMVNSAGSRLAAAENGGATSVAHEACSGRSRSDVVIYTWKGLKKSVKFGSVNC